MSNKRGRSENNWWVWIIGVIVVVFTGAIVINYANQNDVFTIQKLIDESRQTRSFTELFSCNFSGLSYSCEWYRPLDYIFGQVPDILIDIVSGNEISAGIVIIAMWTAFLLIFHDSFKLFRKSFYSFMKKPQNWIILIYLLSNNK